MTAVEPPDETPEERKRRLARERQQRRRDRIKAGKKLHVVEIDDVNVTEALSAQGDLDPQRDDDAGEVRAALERAIARWTRHA
jgi:hypothetical protein